MANFKPKPKKENDGGHSILVDPEQRKKFKQCLATITHYLQIIDDQKEAIKDTVEETSIMFAVDKKFVRRLATVMFKHNYADIQEENEHFSLLYETLVGLNSKTKDPLELDDSDDSDDLD
jgi:hypothetical protein